MFLYVAIGGLFAFLGGMVWFSTLDFPELEKSELDLLSVDVVEIDSIENRIFLKVIFGITNHGERTVTVPEISFELFAILNSNNTFFQFISMYSKSVLHSNIFTSLLKSNLTNVFNISATSDVITCSHSFFKSFLSWFTYFSCFLF